MFNNSATSFLFSRSHGWEWTQLPKPGVNRDTFPRPSLGLTQGVLTLTGGFDLDEADLSSVIEEWDEEAGAWVEARGQEIMEAGWRHTTVQMPTRLLDDCH